MCLASGFAVARLQGNDHAHQLRQALGPHFFHDPGAVDFNRARRNVQLVGDNLVRPAGGQKIEDLALALGQAGEAGFRLLGGGRPLGGLLGLGQRRGAMEASSTASS